MDSICNTKVITASLITSYLLSTLIIKHGLPILKGFKLNQIIREEGPKTHLKKSRTPTMGGILIVPVGLLIGNLFGFNLENYEKVIALSLLSCGYMLIGFIDDWRSLSEKKNTGLNAKSKLLLQIIIGVIFLKWAFIEQWISPDIFLLYDNYINSGIFIWPIALFILLAESNATNLTDGLDGLASGCGSLVFTGLAFQLILREGNEGIAIASFCMAMTGSYMGFLLYNKHPAKIFMGDTGSLAMGGALGGIALVTNSLWSLLIMGGIFFIESLSVIVQVSIFKVTKAFSGKGKRVFRMAPIHHHYELEGIEEKNIVNRFWLITILLICLGNILRST
tara:strand:+ start:4409 stop:5416 length:1008 start_codon:yes stop_codon:yes gene_type:complete